MSKELVSAATYIVLCYAGLGVVLFLLQRSFIYFPTPFVKHEFGHLTFFNNKVSINTIYVNQAKSKAVLYFGGNAESVAYTAAEFPQKFSDTSLYFVNYRGYGGSGGSPSEAAIFSDALSLYDQLALIHDEIFVIGRSLGSGVATYLASKRPVEKVVLVTPFDSILSVAQRQFPIYPMSVMLKDKFDSISYVTDIKAKVLVIVAEHDEVIGSYHTQKLIDALDDKITDVLFIKGAGHNDISLSPSYYQAMFDFLRAESEPK